MHTQIAKKYRKTTCILIWNVGIHLQNQKKIIFEVRSKYSIKLNFLHNHACFQNCITSHFWKERKSFHHYILIHFGIYNILYSTGILYNNASCSSSYLQMHISISTIQPMLNRWVDPLGVDDCSLGIATVTNHSILAAL